MNYGSTISEVPRQTLHRTIGELNDQQRQNQNLRAFQGLGPGE